MRLRALVVLLMLTMTRVAWAQDAGAAQPPTTASAREAFRRGEAAYSAGSYETAVREWTNAYAVDPRPRIQFNLSQAYERMGRLEDAIGALKRFLESGDPEDPTYSDANARLVALQQRLSSTGVIVQGGTEGGQILVDEQDWGRTPRPDRITVPPGNHVIVVRWPSGREFRTNVFVPAGQVVEIVVPSEGQPSAQPVPPPSGVPGTEPGAPPPSSNRRWLWYGLGAGTAAVGAGLLIYGITRGVAKSKCGDTDALDLQTYCNPDSEDAAKRQSLAGYITGAVLLVGSAPLFVVGALSGRHDDARLGKTECGFGLTSARCTLRF